MELLHYLRTAHPNEDVHLLETQLRFQEDFCCAADLNRTIFPNKKFTGLQEDDADGRGGDFVAVDKHERPDSLACDDLEVCISSL